MITKIKGSYRIICDECGEVFPKKFKVFYDAVNYKKDNKWKSRKIPNGWKEICPDCQKFYKMK